MPLGQSQDIPQADPGGMATPRFWHRLIRFRHVISGSLALASLNHACRSLVPTFPQRSPPWILTAAACGGLTSTPDCRTRRALLHLSYSCVLPCGPAILVTQCHERTFRLTPYRAGGGAVHSIRSGLSFAAREDAHVPGRAGEPRIQLQRHLCHSFRPCCAFPVDIASRNTRDLPGRQRQCREIGKRSAFCQAGGIEIKNGYWGCRSRSAIWP